MASKKHKVKYLLTILTCLVIVFSYSFADPNKPKRDPDPNIADVNHPETKIFVSEEQTKFYHETNAVLLMARIRPKSINGPHAGPGYILAIDGPLFEITWVGKEEDPNNMTKRLVPFSSIITIDRPLTGEKLRKWWVVYYKAPSGKAERAILLQEENLFDSFKKRWKSYLLSQERIN